MSKILNLCLVLGMSMSGSTGCKPGQGSDCANGGCEDHDACGGGSLCSDGCCWQVCNDDAECGHRCTASDRSGEICESGLCRPGCRDQAPTLTGIDGDGAVNADDDPATSEHHIDNGLVLEGSGFDGALVRLASANGAPTALDIESRTDTRMEVCLPDTVLPETTYSLTVANQAGEACGDFRLVQGEPGATGDPGSYTPGTGVQIVSGTISADIGIGAEQVAAGDHNHDSEIQAAITGALADLSATSRVTNTNGNPNLADDGLDLDAAASESDWWAVCRPDSTPVGTHVAGSTSWAPLSLVPADADWVELRVKITGSVTTAGASNRVSEVHARANGSSEDPGEANLIAAAGTYGATGFAYSVSTHPAPLAGGCLDLRWMSQFPDIQYIKVFLVGWGRNP